MSRGLRAPIADVFGDAEALPALTCRASELALVHDALVQAGEVVSLELPSGAQAVEISIINESGSAARFSFVADEGAASDPVLLLAEAALPRRVPNAAQVVDIRAVAGGDTIHFSTDVLVHVSVHAHIGA